ncbi:hypothetical protein PIROE2DRAFT_41845 [Piromyces sp. E2]|nr:hypothetical protein PIROE2DRAFT_41845 [Piromyces sp. E2]|eukprot:OUM65255.1 hypothetical protein PIROE2DRAFT_41845 [Piromyces sp. E2]
MSSFSTIVAVLRFRAHSEQNTSVSIVDQKGKEISSMNYERLNSRSEKVAQVLKERGTLNKGDCVALLYKSNEILEFMVALFGCFYAGMVAIPIITSSVNPIDEIKEIEAIFAHSNCKFGLTTDNSLKSFQNKTSQTNFPFQVNLPRIEWLKTVDLGVYHPKKKGVEELINVNSNEIAYISYSKNNDYALKGSLIDHKTIMNTCMNIKGVNKFTSSDVILSNIESRNNIGLMNNILFSVYNGNDVIFMTDSPTDTSNTWCNVVTKNKVTISISSYASMVSVANNINNSPPKKNPVDLSSLQTIIIPTHISYGDVNEYIENSLSPYGLQSNIISPMGMLTEYGGTIFCMRNRVLAKQNVKLLDLFINTQYMKCNKVKITAQCSPGVQQPPNTTRATELGFILPEVNIAIVNPIDQSLCPSQSIGEIWISAPNYLPSKVININKQDENGVYAEAIADDYIPTGIIGFILEPSNDNDLPRLFSLGLKKDVIKQLRTIAPPNINSELPPDLARKKWVTHMSNHLINTVLSQVPHITSASTYILPINNDYLPTMMIETSVGENDYKNIIGMVMKKLEEIQGYKLYCITLSSPNSLPREQVYVNGVGFECHERFRTGNLNLQFFFVNSKIVKDIPEYNNSSLIANRLKLMSKISSEHLQVICGKDCLPILEDHTQVNLLEFKSVLDILIWRAKQYPKELVYNTIDNKGREGRGVTFSKLLTKVYSLAHYLVEKKGVHPGDHVMIIFTHGLDYIYALHACMYIGAIAIPFQPPDINHLPEIIPNMLSIIEEFKINLLLVNEPVEEALKGKRVQAVIKEIHQKTSDGRTVPKLPAILLASKATKIKQFNVDEDSLYKPIYDNTKAALVFVIYDSSYQRACLKFTNEAILSLCKSLAHHYQLLESTSPGGSNVQNSFLPSSKPLLSCVRSYEGMGLISAAMLGVFTGAMTLLIPPYDFFMNPQIWFETVHKYKIKDVFCTMQMMEHAINVLMSNGSIDGKLFSLHNLKNLAIISSERPKPIEYDAIYKAFYANRLDERSIAPLYSSEVNPFVASKGYTDSNHATLLLDASELRKGKVKVLKHIYVGTILVRDSGIITCDSKVAIVNPETKSICLKGEIGEIWVKSKCNASGYYGSVFGEGYIKTGDYGFLWNIPLDTSGKTNSYESVLFVVSSLDNIIIINGLKHILSDIEQTIEKSHDSIPRYGCVVFQTDGKTVAIVECQNDNEIYDIISNTLNSVLEQHKFILDEIVIVAQGSLCKNRLHEKQRKRIEMAYKTHNL